MAYKIVIADVTELSEEIIDVTFNSKIPEDSFARSSDIEAELVIHGKVSFDADKLFMRDADFYCISINRRNHPPINPY